MRQSIIRMSIQLILLSYCVCITQALRLTTTTTAAAAAFKASNGTQSIVAIPDKTTVIALSIATYRQLLFIYPHHLD